jgi:hypothetical protein
MQAIEISQKPEVCEFSFFENPVTEIFLIFDQCVAGESQQVGTMYNGCTSKQPEEQGDSDLGKL